MSASKKKHSVRKRLAVSAALAAVATALCVGLIYLVGYSSLFSLRYSALADTAATTTAQEPSVPAIPPVDTHAYDLKLLFLAHVATSSPWYQYFVTGTTTGSTTVHKELWPVKAVYPADSRALLPFNRIVAYYGNFYSKGMGVLGQYPEVQMLDMLRATVASWEAADPSTPVIPAIDYIAATAQGSPGKDGTYRFQMPDSQIDHALELAGQVNGIVILDVQVGDSTVEKEVPVLEKYLKMPNVELALDPEFDMPAGVAPGRVIGSMSADEINYAAQYLANLVRTYNLPPKILVVHRFTEDMVRHAEDIRPLPEVQMVMDMDGWGFEAKKINTYNAVINPEPVQFTGFKLFYKNDLLPPSTHMMTPESVLKLTPAPSFIQYQ